MFQVNIRLKPLKRVGSTSAVLGEQDVFVHPGEEKGKNKSKRRSNYSITIKEWNSK